MTVYKCADKLSECFDSIIAQIYNDYEVVVVAVDRNDTTTWEVCRRYSDVVSRFKIIYIDDRIGIAKALNIGLGYCKGKYIARLDGDDTNYSTRLEIQLRFMEEHTDIDLCCGNMMVQ